MTLVKVLLFLTVVIGLAIYFFTHLPEIFQSNPQERIFPDDSIYRPLS